MCWFYLCSHVCAFSSPFSSRTWAEPIPFPSTLNPYWPVPCRLQQLSSANSVSIWNLTIPGGNHRILHCNCSLSAYRKVWRKSRLGNHATVSLYVVCRWINYRIYLLLMWFYCCTNSTWLVASLHLYSCLILDALVLLSGPSGQLWYQFCCIKFVVPNIESAEWIKNDAWMHALCEYLPLEVWKFLHIYFFWFIVSLSCTWQVSDLCGCVM